MGKNKKIIIYIIVGALLVAIATAGTIIVLNSINNQNSKKTNPVTTKDSAKTLQTKAEEARKNNDKTKAKTLLLEAQKQYSELPKTDKNTNAQEDIKAQLFLLEHAK